jgi:alpha-D-ribose 1-methylphosphonate 5-triphosphate synthase subunit PhnH
MFGSMERRPAPTARFDPVFASQATFRAVLDAMARPGTVLALPVADPTSPSIEARYLTALLLTLLDHEVTFSVVPAGDAVGETAAARLTVYLVETTGCRAVPVEAADYVIALGPLPAGLPVCLKRGEPAYPDRGATLIWLVPTLTDERQSDTAVALSGPGVRSGDALTLRLAGLTTADLAALAAANAEPPCGIDLILTDAAGNVSCLPRSTRLVPHPPSPPLLAQERGENAAVTAAVSNPWLWPPSRRPAPPSPADRRGGLGG